MYQTSHILATRHSPLSAILASSMTENPHDDVIHKRYLTARNVILITLLAFLSGIYFTPIVPKNIFGVSLKDSLFPLLGGLGLFFFGMQFTSKGLQKSAGPHLKDILRKLTKNRFLGISLGALVTMILQSSSVTTVMTIGFLNAGLMQLKQAIAVILGTNIGTTITAQIISFQIHHYALPIIAIGAFISIFSKSPKAKVIGDSIFGFGILFFGLSLMKDAFAPFEDKEEFKNLFITFGVHPWIALFTGTVFTILLQSSTVTIGIIVALSLSGLMTLGAAIPLVLGSNIGTTVTANLAAIGGSTSAKRAARAHFIFNMAGALIVMFIIPIFAKVVELITPSRDITREVANAHTLFNVLNTIVFLPLIGFLAAASKYLVKKESKQDKEIMHYLDDVILEDSSTALDQTMIGIHELSEQSTVALQHVYKLFDDKSGEGTLIMEQERLIDQYCGKLDKYIGKIVQQDIAEQEAGRVPIMLNMIHEFEKIGDQCERIAETMNVQGQEITGNQKKYLKKITKKTIEITEKIQQFLKKPNRKTAGAIGNEVRSIEEETKKNRKKASAAEIDMLASLTDCALRCDKITQKYYE